MNFLWLFNQNLEIFISEKDGRMVFVLKDDEVWDLDCITYLQGLADCVDLQILAMQQIAEHYSVWEM